MRIRISYKARYTFQLKERDITFLEVLVGTLPLLYNKFVRVKERDIPLLLMLYEKHIKEQKSNYT